MARRLVWITMMIWTLALGASVVRAEEGQHQGRMHEACKADREKFCKDVKGGDHEAMRKCMHDHENELSEGCKQAREEMKKHEHKGG
jgi:hypothetical protein